MRETPPGSLQKTLKVASKVAKCPLHGHILANQQQQKRQTIPRREPKIDADGG